MPHFLILQGQFEPNRIILSVKQYTLQSEPVHEGVEDLHQPADGLGEQITHVCNRIFPFRINLGLEGTLS